MGPGGDTDVLSVTLPLNPLMLVRVAFETAEEPLLIVSDVGVAETENPITVTDTRTVLARVPLSPLMKRL